HGVLAQRAAIFTKLAPGFRSSICEVYYDSPKVIADEGGNIAWSCVSEGTKVDFQRTERDDVQFKVRGEYAAILELARYDTERKGERMAELGQLAEQCRAEGRMTAIRGVTFEEPDGLPPAHDLIARMTL